MSEYIKIILIVISSCLLIAAVKEIKSEYSLYLSIFCGISILLYCIGDIKIILENFHDFSALSNLNDGGIKIFFKAVAISLVSQFACEICSDCNNKFLYFCVELTGKCAILLISLPLIASILNIIGSYMGA